MTATITVRQTDAIVFLTDGLGADLDGVPREVSKCALLPGARAIVAGRGIAELPWLLAAEAAAMTFDDIVRNGGKLMREQLARLRAQCRPEDIEASELYLAGHSGSQNCLMLYFMAMGDRYRERGWSPFVWIKVDDIITAAPLPDRDELFADGFLLPKPDDFDASSHGVRIMKAQHKVAPSIIGGSIQISRVTADSVSSQTIRPDWG